MPEITAAQRSHPGAAFDHVTIPRGVTAGQRIRLAGQGGAGFGGGPAGDLFLEIEFEPHRLFVVDGHRDIYLELPVAPWEAALGARVNAHPGW